MAERGFGISTKRWAHFVGVGTSFIVLLTVAARAESTDNISVVRELAGQVGQIAGKALACSAIQPRAIGIAGSLQERFKIGEIVVRSLSQRSQAKRPFTYPLEARSRAASPQSQLLPARRDRASAGA